MIQQFSSKFLAPTKKLRRLLVLMAIESNANISQHAIGKRARLSSAMVNNYMKELQKEKLITMSGDNNRTQTYHLTEAGKQELMELLGLYSVELVEIYGNARSELRQIKNINTSPETVSCAGEK